MNYDDDDEDATPNRRSNLSNTNSNLFILFFSSFTFFCLFPVRLYIVAFYDSFVNDGVVSCYVSPWKLNKDEMTDSRCLLHCTVSYYIPCLTLSRLIQITLNPFIEGPIILLARCILILWATKYMYLFIYLFIYSGFNNNRYIYTDIYVNQYIKYMDIEKGLSVQKLIMIGLPVRAKSVPKILSIIYIILNSKICNSSSHVLWFYWKKTNTSWDRFCDNLLSTWVS